ncbi:hypothetical protein OG203_03925 [Nocardia sp. NBC_01499]|uniref:hypothetical protein n=1 Tax=Nocardia sp. NBC_01499 TaxID=2903597 RepID=UPI0038630D55
MTLLWVRDTVLFRCPTVLDADGKGIDQRVGALSPENGAVLWQRQLVGRDSFALESADALALRRGSGFEIVDLRTGQKIAQRDEKSGDTYRSALAGGAALVMNSITLSQNTEMAVAFASSLHIEPWGALIPGKDGAFAVIPAR